MNEKNRDIINWQKVIKQAVNAKAKMNCQVFSPVQTSDIYCFYSSWPIKIDSEDKKDFEVKKTPNIFTINHNSSDGGLLNQFGQTHQPRVCLRKKVLICAKVRKTNLLIFWPLELMLLQLRKIKSRGIVI